MRNNHFLIRTIPIFNWGNLQCTEVLFQYTNRQRHQLEIDTNEILDDAADRFPVKVSSLPSQNNISRLSRDQVT